MQSILFLCTGNSCRSQMAEAWCRHLFPDVEAASAGIKTHGVNPNAVRVMLESGIDMSTHRSQLLSEFEPARFTFVVTVCDNAKESCPVALGADKLIHHSFDDPPALAASETSEDAVLDIYRRVRDEIRDFVVQLPLMQ